MPLLENIPIINNTTETISKVTVTLTDLGLGTVVSYDSSTDSELTFTASSVTIDIPSYTTINDVNIDLDLFYNSFGDTCSQRVSFLATGTIVFPLFFGTTPFADGRPIANQALIDAGNSIVVDTSNSVSISFNTAEPVYLWFAIKATEPIKTRYIQPLGTGDMGGIVSVSGNLFPNPELVSIDGSTFTGEDYNIYIANYATEIDILTVKNL